MYRGLKNKILCGLGITLTALTVSFSATDNFNTYAAKEAKYSRNEKTEEKDIIEVRVLSNSLNVRTGPGVNYDVIVNNGQRLFLLKNEVVCAIETATDLAGDEWYYVCWIDGEEEIYGYISASLCEITGNPATCLTTPTPLPTNTPTPTPTPTNTPTPAPTEVPVEPENPTFGKEEITAFAVIAIIAITIVVLYFLVIRKKLAVKNENAGAKLSSIRKNTSNTHIDDIEREKKLYGDQTKARVRGEAPKAKSQESSQDNADNTGFADEIILVDGKSEDLAAEVNEKNKIREELFNLQEKDFVIHTIWGQGVVVDNSDVDNVEVKFENGDTKYINKERAAARKQMRKL